MASICAELFCVAQREFMKKKKTDLKNSVD